MHLEFPAYPFIHLPSEASEPYKRRYICLNIQQILKKRLLPTINYFSTLITHPYARTWAYPLLVTVPLRVHESAMSPIRRHHGLPRRLTPQAYKTSNIFLGSNSTRTWLHKLDHPPYSTN